MHSTVMRSLVAPLLVASVAGGLAGQERSKVERLGYPAGTKLLIVHADDIGMDHSQNAATMAAYEKGGASSGSVLVPAPWTPEFAAWYAAHPDADVGVHLTLTAEWKYLRWPALLPRQDVPSLYDQDGFLPRSVEEVARAAKANEAEKELRAQLARAKELGIRPTHLDMHMAGVMATREIFDAYLRVARENRLPALIPMELLTGQLADWTSLVRPGEVLVDHYVMAPGTLKPEQWQAFYTNTIRSLKPGTVTQIIVHLGYDDAEMRAATVDHDEYGSAWRQRDFDFFTSPTTRKLLEDNGVRLTTWRELAKLLPAS